MKRYMAARQDVVKYLALEREAPDRATILKQIEAIHLWLAQVS